MKYGVLAKKLQPEQQCLLIGSLPFDDSARAVEFILSKRWVIPSWPQIKVNDEEGSFLSCLSPEWEAAEEPGIRSIKEALSPAPDNLPLIKGHVVGPITAAIYSKDLYGSLEQRLEAATRLVIDATRKQYAEIHPLADSVLIVLDEPGLESWKDLPEEDQLLCLEAFSYVSVVLQEMGVHVGLHACCTFDTVFLMMPVELISFDLTDTDMDTLFAEGSAKLWRDSVSRGVVFTPGIAPAVAPGVVEVSEMEAQLAAAVELFNCFQERLTAELDGAESPRCLWSASCGHAGASAEWLNRLYQEPLRVEPDR